MNASIIAVLGLLTPSINKVKGISNGTPSGGDIRRYETTGVEINWKGKITSVT